MEKRTRQTEPNLDRLPHNKHLSQAGDNGHSLSRDSGINSLSVESGIHPKGSLRSSGSRAFTTSPRSSVRSSLDRTLPRELDFNDDDTMTYASSSSIRDMFRDLESVPVKDKEGGDMQGYYDAPSVLSPRSSLRGGVHDSMVMSSGVFPDTDSGFSSSFKGKNLQHSDDFMASPRSQQASPGALVKARSMNRLNSPFVSQEMTPYTLGPYHLDRSLRNLKGNLEDSENRRCVLMHKLKEAQDTLELQSDRLAKIENAAKGNSILVEDLKLKERDYRKRIDSLKLTEQEKDILKMENIKLRQEMQDRIDKLDFALRSLQAQHHVTENENQKRISLLEQTSHAMSLLETENNRLQQDNSTMKQEMAVAKEAIHLARSKFEPMEDENKNLRVETLRLKEENAELSKKVSELTGQLMELRKLTQSMKDENEKLAESWKTLSEDKQKISKQLDSAQEKTTDLRSKVSTASAEKDRLFQEKMDLNNKFQQLLINKEQLERTKILLEEQLNDQSTEVARAKQTSKKRDEEKKRLEEELHDMKRAEQDLSSELSSVRAYYERALEQISTLESGKKVQQQQNDWNTQEQERLKAEVDRLSKVSEGKTKELKREKEEMEESIQNLKGELRNLRGDNSLLENKVEELETKLNKANEDIKYSATTSQEELDTWKDTCDRLTASVSRKESEVQALSDKCLDLEDVTGKLHSENRVLKDECDHLSEQVEDIKKLKDQNRKLIQEKAENEQMIKLLETQKEVLTKSSENQLSKLHDVEHLTHKVDQFRNENEHLRERVLELEKVRDNLVEQKEDLLASTELIYKKPKLEELEKRIDELREANKQLRDINEDVNEKVDSLEQQLYMQSAPDSMSHDQAGLKVNRIVSESGTHSFSKNYLKGKIIHTKQSEMAGPSDVSHDTKPWSAGRHKTEIVNSPLGPVLLGEDVVFESEIPSGDKCKIIVDPKLGAILVHKQEVPCSDIGHILIGQRVVKGSRVSGTNHSLETKFGIVSLDTKVVFESDINSDDENMIVNDAKFGKILISKKPNVGKEMGERLEGMLVVSCPDVRKRGGKSYGISGVSGTSDNLPPRQDTHDHNLKTKQHNYIETDYGPVLVRDGSISESDIGPEEMADIVIDPNHGKILISKHPVHGTKVSEILTGRKVVSGKETRKRNSDAENANSSLIVHGKMFSNSELGPVLIGEAFIPESEVKENEHDRVIEIPEVGKVLVSQQQLPGTGCGSVLIGKRVTSLELAPRSEKSTVRIADCELGQIIISDQRVNESDLTPDMADDVIKVPEVGLVIINKVKVTDSDVDHVLVGKKIKMNPKSKLTANGPEILSRQSNSSPTRSNGLKSNSKPKQKIIESGLGCVLLSDKPIIESELDLGPNESIIIDPENGPIVVSKQCGEDSELGIDIFVGRKVIPEQVSKYRSNVVVDTGKGQVLLMANAVLESDLDSQNKEHIICDPNFGKMLITKEKYSDLTLPPLPIAKQVLSPLKYLGRNVTLDTQQGKVSVVQDVAFESELNSSEQRNIVTDPRHGKIFVSQQKVTDPVKGETSVGCVCIKGSRVDNSLTNNKRVLSHKKFGRVCIDDQVIFECDVTPEQRCSIIDDPKLGPVLVTGQRVFDRLAGNAVIGKRVVSSDQAFVKVPEKKTIRHGDFGTISISDEVVFDSDLCEQDILNLIEDAEFGTILVDRNDAHESSTFGQVRVGRRVVSGTKIPKQSKVVLDSPKGCILIGSEMVLDKDISQEDMANVVVDPQYGPMLISNKSVVDSNDEKLLIGKRIVKPSKKTEVMFKSRVVKNDRFGSVLVGESFVLDSEIDSKDTGSIFVDPIEGPILVSGEVRDDQTVGKVTLGKKIVSGKKLPDGKSLYIQSKKGPLVVKDDVIFESDLLPQEREDLFLHPDLGPVLVTKKLVQDPEKGPALLGKRVLLNSQRYGRESKEMKFVKDPKLGSIVISSQAVCESDLSPSDKMKLISDPESGYILITNEVVNDPEKGIMVVGKRVIKCPSKQYIKCDKGAILKAEETLSESELSESQKRNVILDPQVGPLLITELTVDDLVEGTVSIGKRIVKPGEYLDSHMVKSQHGPILVGTRTVLESDLSLAERESIVLDPKLGPVLLTNDFIETPEAGRIQVGKRVVLTENMSNTPTDKSHDVTEVGVSSDNINATVPEINSKSNSTTALGTNLKTNSIAVPQTKEAPHSTVSNSAGREEVAWTSEGRVMVKGEISESEVKEYGSNNIIQHPDHGPILITGQTTEDPVKGLLPIGKRIVVGSKKGKEKENMIETPKGPVWVSSESVNASELSPLERENVIVHPEVGIVFISGESKYDPALREMAVGKKVTMLSELQCDKRIIPSSHGQVLVDDHCMLSDVNLSEVQNIVVDPDVGPVLVTKQTVHDPEEGRVLRGKRIWGLETQGTGEGSDTGNQAPVVIKCRQGPVLVSGKHVNESELTMSDRENVVLDPELGPILITGESVDDQLVGPVLIGKKIHMGASTEFKGTKVADSCRGPVMIGDQEIAESDLSQEERESVMIVPNVGIVLITGQSSKKPGEAPVLMGKRVHVLSSPKVNKAMKTTYSPSLITESLEVDPELTTAKRLNGMKEDEQGPAVASLKHIEDPVMGSNLVRHKFRTASVPESETKKIVQTVKGQVLISEVYIRESQLAIDERENIVQIPGVGPVLITKEKVSEPGVGSVFLGRRVTGRRKSTAKNKIIKTKQGAVLVGEDSVLDRELKMTDWENIVMNPDLGPILVKHQSGYDPAFGKVLTGKRVIVTSKVPNDKQGILKTKKGQVFVVKESVHMSDLSSKQREDIIYHPEFGFVTLTGGTVPDPEKGVLLEGKKVLTSTCASGSSEVFHSRYGTVTVGKECVLESELSQEDLNNIVTDLNLGPVLVCKKTTPDTNKVSNVGKRVVSFAKVQQGRQAEFHVTEEQAIHESDLTTEQMEKVHVHPDVGPVILTGKMIPHPNYGIINVVKRVITKGASNPRTIEKGQMLDNRNIEGYSIEANSVKELPNHKQANGNEHMLGSSWGCVQSQDRTEIGFPQESVGSQNFEVTDEIPNTYAQFVIESELGPLYVERIFAPGTKDGFIMKGSPISSQGQRSLKRSSKDEIILETELGNIFIDQDSASDTNFDYSSLPKIKLSGSTRLLNAPKGRQIPSVPVISDFSSSKKKLQLISDFSVFDRLSKVKAGIKYVSQAIQTMKTPLVCMETQTVLDSDAMTFLTGKFYHEANIELREAVGGDGSVVPKYDLERVRDEKERIESDMDNLRRDYDALIERHDQYVQDYGPDGEEVLREKNKVRGLEREKEGLEKQVALINGQLLLVESSKKRLDEVVEDLQHEIVHLRKELEEAEKQPVGGPELDQLQSEVEELRNELTRSQKEKMKQENLVRSLKEDLDEERSKNPSQIRESLDDVGTELNGMRGELHKLMGVIQSKDQAIETLENQLRQSKEKIEDRDKEMLELKTYLKDKNVETAKSYEDIPKRTGYKASKIPRRSDDGKSTGTVSRSLPKLESKLLKPMKPAESSIKMQRSKESESDLSKTMVTPGLYGTKYVSSQPQRTQSLTEKGSGDRLQSLISKYRSYGETSQQPERKIKPLSLTGSNKMGLVTRGRSFGPAAPKGSDGKVSPVTEVENEGDQIPQLPKAPPPIIRVTTPDDEGPLAQSSPTVFTLAGPDSQDGKAPGRVAVSQDEGTQSGEEYDYDDDDDLDTQEQRDINSLIQNCYRSHLKFLVALRRDRGQSSRKSGGGKKRATHPKPILSVSPPKLTSKVIGDLLRTHPTSEQTKSHPGSPDPTPANQSPGSPKSSSANPDMSN